MYFWRNLSKESKRTTRLGESAASTTERTKSVELQSVYARVHLLNEGGLYKMDQNKKCINELQFYYITRWHRCSRLY